MTNYIKNLLRIKEPNLEITDVTQEKIQNQQTNIIHAVLSPAPENCSTCGSTPFDKNGKQIIVKNGKKIVALCQIGLMSNSKEISIRSYSYRGLFIQSSRLSHLS